MEKWCKENRKGITARGGDCDIPETLASLRKETRFHYLRIIFVGRKGEEDAESGTGIGRRKREQGGPGRGRRGEEEVEEDEYKKKQ